MAKKAVAAGLTVAPYVKTSLSPGSGVVTYYLRESGVIPFLQKLGFDIVGYGWYDKFRVCMLRSFQENLDLEFLAIFFSMTCIGNSGPLPDSVGEALEKVFFKNINAADAANNRLTKFNS